MFTFNPGNGSLYVHVIPVLVVQGMIGRRTGGDTGSVSVLSGPLEVVIFRTVVVATQTVLERALSGVGVVVHWEEGVVIKKYYVVKCCKCWAKWLLFGKQIVTLVTKLVTLITKW